MCSFAITPCFTVTCSHNLKCCPFQTKSSTVGRAAAWLGALLRSTIGMCFSLSNICNKYFTDTCCLGPVESIPVMYAAMQGQCQSAWEKRNRVRVLCKPAAAVEPKKQLEYLLWAAWFSVLAFWIKVGRLKHFPGISWWSHCRQRECWLPDKPVHMTW